ncbi:hypothetical protein ASPWEDRAFT_44914 [Aspergillus wentii DTO 134E9]|uniref:Uncharacterized protein n=1 Tax=Aspergillus wentii DTO 134E9 TaxID=1073089 RepID=A0A1L9R7V7_ASPWE|nr:uncharacterized protein ASPWEDRAFT_44914 [Aspergillus wentii DTO 134E9]OJJ30967.1 hypothetical protein ASPWEDRAFT_44914 [Aspergillus wentii DTO 134E9]
MYNQEQRGFTGPVEILERYKVLWVEWKEVVAYRLASGWVKKGRMGQVGTGGYITGAGLMLKYRNHRI